MGDEGLQGTGLYVVHDFGPDGSVTTEDPEDRLLPGPSPPFCTLIPDDFPLVLPLPTEVGFIYLDRTGEDLRDITGKSSTDGGKSPQDPSPFERGSERDILAALFEEEPPDNLSPLIPGQVKREPTWGEVIPAPRATPFSGPKEVYFFRPAFWALYPDHFSLVNQLRGWWLKCYYTLIK